MINHELTEKLNQLLPGSWYVQHGKWNHLHDSGYSPEVEWSIWCAKTQRRWAGPTLLHALNELEDTLAKDK